MALSGERVGLGRWFQYVVGGVWVWVGMVQGSAFGNKDTFSTKIGIFVG